MSVKIVVLSVMHAHKRDHATVFIYSPSLTLGEDSYFGDASSIDLLHVPLYSAIFSPRGETPSYTTTAIYSPMSEISAMSK